MIAATTLRDMWEEIVTSHEAALSFASIWNLVPDENHDAAFPRAVWKPPDQSGIRQGKSILDAFNLMISFEERHDTDRTAAVRDATHSDMSLVARECFYRFLALYCNTITTFNGQDIDLRLDGTYTLTPFWDNVGTMTTGVTLTFTVIDQTAPCVLSDTFPLT